MDDLYQLGCIGFLKAVDGFVPATGEGVTSCWLQNKTNATNLFSPSGYLVHSGNASPDITWHPYESSAAPMYKWKHQGVSFDKENTLYTSNNLKADAPLLMVFHGYGSRDIPSIKYGFQPVADKHGFAICYPRGPKDQKGKRYWSVGYQFHIDNGMMRDDTGFAVRLVKHLQKNYNLSHHNVFATGHSNGGAMSYMLAYKEPETFAAVASVSGHIMEVTYSLRWVLALLFVVLTIVLITQDCNIGFISHLDSLLGAMAYVGWGTYLLRKKHAHIPAMLTASSFFLFAYHQLPVRLVTKMVAPYITESGYGYMAAQLVICVIMSALGVGGYYMLKSIFPRFTAFLCGGR